VLEEFVETVDGVKLRKIEQIMTISHEDQISAIITQIINPVTGGTEAVDLNFV
jgi:DNA repair exonuclease SbcCD ATPase subunit